MKTIENARSSMSETDNVSSASPKSDRKSSTTARNSARSGNVKPKPLPVFATHAPRLAERGYAAIPIVPRSKRPVPEGWSAFSTVAPTAHQIDKWSIAPTYGLGVVGGYANLVGIDIDSDDPDIKAALYQALPHTDVRKAGAKGETLFYHCPGLPSKSYNITDGEFDEAGKLKTFRAVDIISAGRFTVLPPSTHPDTGKPYVWTGPITLEDVDPSDLPPLPANILDLIAEALRPFGLVAAEERAPRSADDDGKDAENWFRDLNNEALERLPDWVPALGLYGCREVKGKGYEAVADWRSSSTGRPVEQRNANLKISYDPVGGVSSSKTGIRDFGDEAGVRGGRYTPIDLVMAAKRIDRSDAIEHLCSALKRDASSVDLTGLLARLASEAEQGDAPASEDVRVQADHMAGSATPNAGKPWDRVNAAAKAEPGLWVPKLFGDAATFDGKHWSVAKAAAPGLVKDVTFRPKGVWNPLTLVKQARGCGLSEALPWLCEAMDRDPADFGWISSEKTKGASGEGEDGLVSRSVNFAGSVSLDDVERKEVIAELPEAGAFPLHALPAILRDAVVASQELSKAPLGLCADVAMTAMALATQSCADVRNRASGGTHPLSTFVLTLGQSGERKSTVAGMLMRPIQARQDELRLAYKDAISAWKITHGHWQHQVDTYGAITGGGGHMQAELNNFLRSNPEPVRPRHFKMLHSAPTAEGLKRAMRDGQLASGMVSDEAGMFLEGHAMKKEQATATMTILSSMWDGKAVDHERAKEEDSYELRGRRLSVGFLVQPTIVKSFLADEKAQGQGFIARFLMSYPTSTIGTRMTEAAPEQLDPRLASYYAYVGDLMRGQAPSAGSTVSADSGARKGNMSGLLNSAPAAEPEELNLPVIEVRAGTAAWEAWRIFNDEIEKEKVDNGVVTGRYAVIRNTANKISEQALRIAGQLHIFDGGAPDGDMSGETMQAGIEIARYYLDEALRLAGGNVVASGEQTALDRLSRYIAKHVEKREGKQAMLFTTRDIRSCPIESRDGETLKKRMAALVGLGHIHAVTRFDEDGNKVPIILNGRSCKEVYEYVPKAA